MARDKLAHCIAPIVEVSIERAILNQYGGTRISWPSPPYDGGLVNRRIVNKRRNQSCAAPDIGLFLQVAILAPRAAPAKKAGDNMESRLPLVASHHRHETSRRGRVISASVVWPNLGLSMAIGISADLRNSARRSDPEARRSVSGMVEAAASLLIVGAWPPIARLAKIKPSKSR